MESNWQTPAAKSPGAIEIPRREYLHRLSAAVKMKCSF
jgi:Leu/Phe-tRNA-protein transferase